jgi:indole-3-glycerol phosphate synthase
MPDFLSQMARSSAKRAAKAKRAESEIDLRDRAADRPPPPPLQLHASCFDLFAEVKRVAPSAGVLADSDDPEVVIKQADSYVRGGAAALSVLTEPEMFRGSLDDLAIAARAVPVPVMRKDFLVDPYQVFEARAAGAAGVLLILRLLDDERLGEMIDAASEAGLFVLLEAFDAGDLGRAGDRVPISNRDDIQTLVGLNARDLASLEVDNKRLADLAGAFPKGVLRVAESGLATPEDAGRMAALGYQVALVGSALMRADDPSKLTAAMIDAGRTESLRECASA